MSNIIANGECVLLLGALGWPSYRSEAMEVKCPREHHSISVKVGGICSLVDTTIYLASSAPL